MPYKSDAQRRYFHAAEERGDISHKTVHEFDEASKGKRLPEKVKHDAKGGVVECPRCGHMFKGGLVEPEVWAEPEEGPEKPEFSEFEEHLAGRYPSRRK